MKTRFQYRYFARTLLLALLAFSIAVAWLHAGAGMYGINALLRRGGSVWLAVTADDPRLSAAMQIAQKSPTSVALAGSLSWQEVAPGFEVGELPVLDHGLMVDRILLTRVDPARYRIEVHSSPAGDKELDDWMKALGAMLVINGSYYGRDGRPATPVLSSGLPLGPASYQATHGALVARNQLTEIVDLRAKSWNASFAGAHDALVSYPLLLGPNGASIGSDSGWLANRSFVGQDSPGRIVFGTTVDAYFTLSRLGEFLAKAPLDLKLALNLDGGPLACQAVAVGAFNRNFCGELELQVNQGNIKLLQPAIGKRRWALPLVISVRPK